MMRRTWPIAFVVVLAGAACDSGDDTDSTPADAGSGGQAATSTGAAASTGTAGSGSGAGGGRLCERTSPPALTPGSGCTQVGTVSGQVLDQDGNPPTSTTFTVCGDACLYGDLRADGTFSIAINHCYGSSVFYEVPVFIYHGEPAYAGVTVKFVPDGATDVPTADIGVITTVATDAMKSYSYPEAVATTFTDDSGFSIDVAECELRLPAFEEELHVGEVALEDFPLPTTPSDLLGLYFVGPDNSHFEVPGLVRFPNTTQLAPGTVVDLMALGNMGTTTVIEAGTWGVVGSGRVSSDGMHVESDPAQDGGLITLGWIGYRRAQ
jgi:hypothetical protein